MSRLGTCKQSRCCQSVYRCALLRSQTLTVRTLFLFAELLEAYGGKDALEAIKRMVPTYESCLCPPEANRGGD